jgi:hypothetical protein
LARHHRRRLNRKEQRREQHNDQHQAGAAGERTPRGLTHVLMMGDVSRLDSRIGPRASSRLEAEGAWLATWPTLRADGVDDLDVLVLVGCTEVNHFGDHDACVVVINAKR